MAFNPTKKEMNMLQNEAQNFGKAISDALDAMFSPPLDENGYDMSVANVGKFMKKRLLLKEANLKRKSKKILL